MERKLGKRTVPVEKAIPSEQKSVDLEHLSHWLDKYDGKYAVGACSCRRSHRVRDEGCGHLEDDMCIAVGDMATYAIETNKARPATREEVMEILQRAEVCPAGATKLGQKLCTKEGPIVYPKQVLPDETKWGPEMWNENYRDDNPSANCYGTGTVPCKSNCPAHIAVQGYIRMAAEGRCMDALKLIKKENPFPAVCGHICNRRCEQACTRGSVDRAVAINEIKKFIAEQELHADKRYVPKMLNQRNIPFTEKIAVIGAGPSGMACAYYLAEKGYLDRNPVPGGMLMLGIPSFRLEKEVVNAEIEILREMGVKFQCGVEAGKDVTIAQLREQGHCGFYVAIGAQKSAAIRCPGETLTGVLGGVDFLRSVNLGEQPDVGKAVAVIGGGNGSIDAARAALRLGAEKVCLVYRCSESELKADREEIEDALAEGMELGEPDASGRRTPVGTGAYETLEVGTVIGTVGQRVDWGMLTGPKFAIDAIAAGKEAAISLHRYVHEGQSLTIGRNRRVYPELDKRNVAQPTACFDAPVRQVPAARKRARRSATRAARSRKSRSKRRRPAALAAACARPDASLTPSTCAAITRKRPR